jgi:hypothetical protein
MTISDPLTNPRCLLTPDFNGNVVFAPDIRSIRPVFLRAGGVLSRLQKISFDVSAITLNRGFVRDDSISIESALARYPASTKYFFERNGGTVLYDCPRDTFSVLFLDWDMCRGELDNLDRIFIEHVRDVGIGFGQEGEQYLSTLLLKMSEDNLLSNERRTALDTSA